MKYRRTGITLALAFWFITVLQIITILYPSMLNFSLRHFLIFDFVSVCIVIAVFSYQHYDYTERSINPSMEWHLGHVVGIIGAILQVLSLFVLLFVNRFIGLIITMIALLIILFDLVVMMNAESYKYSNHKKKSEN